MKKYLSCIFTLAFSLGLAQAQNITARIPQFSNKKVTVWKTVIYPEANQSLKMHRHDHDRVLVALTDGVLQVNDNQGKSHLLKFKKDRAYYLTKDKKGVLHNDVNLTKKPIRVMIIDLND
ncbi:MAG: hypothetical protein EPN84_01140 [Legionella sp.]|nr:MAG: hypothetical protein EPN84_01140 [Legionella sp.]